MTFRKLEDGLVASFDPTSGVTLLEGGSYRPKELVVLSDNAMAELVIIYTEGLCPVCLDEIPSGDIVCNDCFEEAKARRA